MNLLRKITFFRITFFKIISLLSINIISPSESRARCGRLGCFLAILSCWKHFLGMWIFLWKHDLWWLHTIYLIKCCSTILLISHEILVVSYFSILKNTAVRFFYFLSSKLTFPWLKEQELVLSWDRRSVLRLESSVLPCLSCGCVRSF